MVTGSKTDAEGNPLDISSNSMPFTYVAIGFVQMQANLARAGTSISATVTNTTAGNLLIAAVSYQGSGPITGTGSLGNTFTSGGKHPWFQGQAEMFYLPNIPGGSVIINATGAAAPWNICVSEYSGGVSLGPVNANNSPSAGTPGVETISGVAVTPALGNMVYVVAFTAHPPNTNLVPDPAFTPHSSPQDLAPLAEDTMNPISAAHPIPTLAPTPTAFLPWLALPSTTPPL